MAAPTPAITPRRSARPSRTPTRPTRRDDSVSLASLSNNSPNFAPSGSSLVPTGQDESRAVATNLRTVGSQSGGVVVGPRRHTVEEGETFASVAKRYYG